jgi:hypothetical protein
MKLKKFLEYSDLYSKDPKTFEKRVIFASGDKYAATMFEEITEADALLNYPDRPIVLWNNMKLNSSVVNENHIFNRTDLPMFKQVAHDFEGADFLPKSTRSRAEVKGLTFPIVGHHQEDTIDLKTYGKFKKSERDFDKFSEKITPVTRFDVIAFRKDPIHLQERVNQMGFDIDPNRFLAIPQIEKCLISIAEKYSPDFYRATFIDDGKKLYLESLSTSAKLTPSQLVKIYEKAYESHYEVTLPTWFKKQLFESYVKPYYSAKYLDAQLLKPKNSIDFKKYSTSC